MIEHALYAVFSVVFRFCDSCCVDMDASQMKAIVFENGSHKCPICDKLYSSKLSFNAHRHKVHGAVRNTIMESIRKCPSCNERAASTKDCSSAKAAFIGFIIAVLMRVSDNLSVLFSCLCIIAFLCF